MKISLLGAESFGVRSLCCFVETKKRNILIDPGVALDKGRHKLLPHPIQVVSAERIKLRIIEKWQKATDVVVSHFHGDHTPLMFPDAYQLSITKLHNRQDDFTIWTKQLDHMSKKEQKRFQALPEKIRQKIKFSDQNDSEEIRFSEPVPHGDPKDTKVKVLMTCIQEGDECFVHASDIQLLDSSLIEPIESWKPDILLVSGPPLYLSNLTDAQARQARENALRLSAAIKILIVDHHVLRSFDGLKWLKQIQKETGNRVISAAEFMGKQSLLLEANRKQLYQDYPVESGWHVDYREGKVDLKPFRKILKSIYQVETHHRSKKL